MTTWFAKKKAIKAAAAAAALGMASEEQIDLLLSDMKAWQGVDLAAMLKRHPHVRLTDSQWDVVLERTYFAIPVAAVFGLPEDVLLRMAAHDTDGIREEAYMNPDATDAVRAVAAEYGVAEDVLDGSRMRKRYESLPGKGGGASGNHIRRFA